jgi:hypothetical protein
VKELEELLASVRAGRHQAQLGEKSTAAETVTLTQQLLAVTAERDAAVCPQRAVPSNADVPRPTPRRPRRHATRSIGRADRSCSLVGAGAACD